MTKHCNSLIIVFFTILVLGCASVEKPSTTTHIQKDTYVFTIPKLNELGIQVDPESVAELLEKQFRRYSPQDSKVKKPGYVSEVKFIEYKTSFQKSASEEPGCQSFLLEYSCSAGSDFYTSSGVKTFKGSRTDIVSVCIMEDEKYFRLKTRHIETKNIIGTDSLGRPTYKAPEGEPSTDLILKNISQDTEAFIGKFELSEVNTHNTAIVVIANIQRLLHVPAADISQVAGVGGKAKFKYILKDITFDVDIDIFTYAKGSKIKLSYSFPVTVNFKTGSYLPSTQTLKEFQEHLVKVFNS